MPGESEQVALEDSANGENMTASAATSEAIEAFEQKSPAEKTSEDPSVETEADQGKTGDSEEAPSSPDGENQLTPSTSQSNSMLAFGGAMLAASVIVLIAAIVIVTSSRTEPPESELINEFRTSMNQMAHKLSQIEAKTEPSPAVIIGEVGNFDDFTRMMKVGNTQFIDGHFEEAAQSYAAAITLDASGKMGDEAHYRLGMCQLKTGDPDEAIEHFRFVVENHPGSHHYAASALEMGELLMAQQNFTQARRLFYMVIGSEGQLGEDQQDILEHTYYAIGRAYEGEAQAIEATRYNPKTAMNFGLKSGEPR